MAIKYETEMNGTGFIKSKGDYRNLIILCVATAICAATAMAASPEQDDGLGKALEFVQIDKAVAATMLEQYMADYPASPRRAEAAMALGDCFYGPAYPQDYRRALEIYDAIDPQLLPYDSRIDMAYRKAYCLIELAYASPARQAEAQYARALKELDLLAGTPKYGRPAQFYKGYIAYAQGDFAKAESILTPLRHYGEPCNMADFYLAQIAYKRGDWQKAYAMATSLLQREGVPRQYANEALRLAGESAYRIGNDPEARKYLRLYCQAADSPLPSARYLLGLYAYQDRDYVDAVRLFSPAAEIDDAMGQSANLYIGQSLLAQGDYDGAVLALDRAKDMSFDRQAQEIAHYNFAVASLQGGKVPFGGGVSAFEDFILAYPESQYAPEAQRYVIDSYFNSGNYMGALRTIESMPRPTAESKRAELTALYRLGAQAVDRGDAAQAISYLERAAKLARYDAAAAREATLLLGEAQYLDGKYALAAKSAQEYLNAAPRSSENRGIAQLDLGYALFAQKKYSKAAPAFRAAIESGALPIEVRADAACRLGDCLYSQKDFAGAADAYDQAFALNPAVGDYALLQKALMEGYQRNHRGKISYIDRLRSEYPASPYIPNALLEMTESYIQLGDNDGAIGIYRQLVDRYPGTAEGRQGYLQMALTMLNTGDKKGAVQAYKDVVRLYPTSDEAAQGAEALKRIAADEGWLVDYADFINSVPGAPKFDASQAEALEFESAEKAFITSGDASRLEKYAKSYPRGAHRAKALSYLLQNAVEHSDEDAAYSIASTLIDEYPDNSLSLEAYAAKAEIDQRRGKRTLALKSWESLARKASTPYYLDMARMGMARNSLELAEFVAAEQAARAALASSTLAGADKTEALYILGAACAGQGMPSEARLAWMQAADGTNDIFGIRSAYNLAQLSYDAGDYGRAEDEAKAVANSDSEHAYWVARAFILLSDIYSRQGNDYKAQQYLKSLRENYPGDESDIFEMIDARINRQ